MTKNFDRLAAQGVAQTAALSAFNSCTTLSQKTKLKPWAWMAGGNVKTVPADQAGMNALVSNLAAFATVYAGSPAEALYRHATGDLRLMKPKPWDQVDTPTRVAFTVFMSVMPVLSGIADAEQAALERAANEAAPQVQLADKGLGKRAFKRRRTRLSKAVFSHKPEKKKTRARAKPKSKAKSKSKPAG